MKKKYIKTYSLLINKCAREKLVTGFLMIHLQPK